MSTLSTPTSTLATPAPAAHAPALWAGRALTALTALFLTFDAVIKLVGEPHAVEATAALGFPAHQLATIGAIELACAVVWLVPRTAVLGAVLLTGYLGGAVACQLRLEQPLLSTTLFPVYVGGMVWAGLALRDPRARAVFFAGAR